MHVIALSGKMHSGKTTAAGFLTPEYKPYKFAAGIYADAAKLNIDTTKKTPAVRRLLQTLGDVRREQNHDHYAIDLVSVMTGDWIADGTTNFVIDDLRFLNEIEVLKVWTEDKKAKLTLLRIVREGYGQDIEHISETNLDSFKRWDEIISIPNGALGELKKRVLHHAD